MALYRLHLAFGQPALLDVPIDTLEDFGRSMVVNRFICGSLLQEGEEPLAEPVTVLIPSTRIHLVSQV